MGASNSKPNSDEPVVFYPPSNASLSISPELVGSLQGKTETKPTPVEKPKEEKVSNLSFDPEQFDRQVHQRVQEEVERIKKEEYELLKNGQDPNLTDTKFLLAHLEDLNKKLQTTPKYNVTSELNSKKEAVIKCYRRNNPKRALDCWEEVESFKAATLKAQMEFIASQN